jgi:hypothetical protein
MQSEVVQEFNNMPFEDFFPAGGYDYPRTCLWESPRLTTMYPAEGAEKGSDRAICRVVNGFVTVKFLDKSAIVPGMRVTAMLIGEYAGIYGIIQSFAVNVDGSISTKILLSNGSLGFEQFQTIGNLAQNIFIRVVFEWGGGVGLPPIKIKTSMTGALLATDARI